MKKLLTCIVLALSCAAIAAPPATTQAIVATAAPPATTQAVSGTGYAFRRARLVAPGTSINQATVEEFLARQAGELSGEILHRPTGNVEDFFRWQYQNFVDNGGITTSLDIAVNLPTGANAKTPAAAREFADAIVESLGDYLRAETQRQRDEYLEPKAEMRHEAEQQVSKAERTAADLREKMRKLAGRGDISGKTITEAITKLEEEKQKLELDTMAKRARREALEKALAQEADKIAAKVQVDPIAAELEKVVKAREEKMMQVKAQASQGISSVSEATESVANLAEARAKLLERKRDATAEAGGDALSALNRELLTLSVDLRELEARLKFVEERLPGLRDATDQLDAWERAENDLTSARADLNTANGELREANRRLAAMRAPQVLVIKSEDRVRRPEGDSMFQPKGLFGGHAEEEQPAQDAPPPAPPKPSY